MRMTTRAVERHVLAAMDRGYRLAILDMTADVVDSIRRREGSQVAYAQQETLVADVRRMADARIARFREALA